MVEIIPFKSFEEQVFEKIRGKNIRIDKQTIGTMVCKLKNHSYYSLINGYKAHFVVPGESDEMIEGTTFQHFCLCKMIEIDMSAVLLKYLQIIEQGFRNRVAYIIAREYGTDDTRYLQKSNFTNTKRKRDKVLKAMRDIRNNPHKNSYSDYFKNKREPRASIPPWILIQDMKFYDVICLYQSLKNELKVEIRSQYILHNPDFAREDDFFANSMQFLREYRNIYAHSKRNFVEKIEYSVHQRIISSCSHFNSDIASDIALDFEGTQQTKSLSACIILILSYLNDAELENRFFVNFITMLLHDPYVEKDENYKGLPIFNGKTIYDILGLSNDFVYHLDILMGDKMRDIN